MDKNTGWRYMFRHTRNYSVIDDWNRTQKLFAAAARLKKVQIEHDDALKVIERFDTPDTLFYLDPPYMPETRNKNWRTRAYRHEMTVDDHAALIDLLQTVQGMVVLSGYANDLYDQFLVGWKRLQKSTANIVSKSVIETLWISPRAEAAREEALKPKPKLPQSPQQMSFLGVDDG